MNWSPMQSRALDEVARFMRDPSHQVCLFAGYAGTGKTTLAKHFVSCEPGQWLFAAYTGKAAYRMRQCGCEGARTIHSLIYRPAGESLRSEIVALEMKIRALEAAILSDPNSTADHEKEIRRLLELRRELLSDNQPRFALWANSPLGESNVDGVVIDEASMVDEQLANDLMSFGKKILVLYDPFQLPPVGAAGYFTKRQPNVMLTEIHRQARDSGVLRLATSVRESGLSALWSHDNSLDCQVIRANTLSSDDYDLELLGASQVLCGTNRTRRALNLRLRELLGRGGLVDHTERIICLKNYRELGLYNGSQWIVDEGQISEDGLVVSMDVSSEDDPTIKTTVAGWTHHFTGEMQELEQMGYERREMCEFDYSYAITVHKAQGSQWENVVLMNESSMMKSDREKWLYTGITRAQKSLTVLSW